MSWLKAIGWLLAAVVVVTMILTGGFILIIVGIAIGLFLDILGLIILTAAALKAHFESDK